MRNGRIGRTLRRAGLAVALAAGLAACTAQIRYHGYMPLPEDLAALQVGIDTRETVAEAVGTPTTGGVLNEGGYYYVRSQFRHFAFYEPQEIDRQVLAITFTPAGVVRNIERFGLEQGRVVVLDRRVTDDNVPDRTFIQQLLRNFGNFDAATIMGDNGLP
ncbi:outer membrane protein assembly factor BamE [Wenxinia marina]|uniref:Beta-barrel assembly machine subunit BamE n=1 Tax=Wenxinia marina DSM 24838 TaxID=1123501 RepID=A0A0D0QA35_9RHOB|nr:outer membrane protein assembly factor BamE [Wenxinia marina]KIQ67868.1 Beta-barrel assembly machine subunit BamE [Wenxinia marina DSM 24838]GGL74439.1 outer membrane protein assembly factor BamE [Wenxinia marina]